MTGKDRGGKEARVGDLVEQLLSSRGLTTQLKKYRAWSCWDEVVGPVIARHAQPLRIRERILEVRVSQSAWMQQLQLLKPKILQQLNARLGDNLLDDIFLKRGPVAAKNEISTAPPVPLAPLSADEREQIDGILLDISDPALRANLSKLIGKDLQFKKSQA